LAGLKRGVKDADGGPCADLIDPAGRHLDSLPRLAHHDQTMHNAPDMDPRSPGDELRDLSIPPRDDRSRARIPWLWLVLTLVLAAGSLVTALTLPVRPVNELERSLAPLTADPGGPE
jgi:hypothetical protein